MPSDRTVTLADLIRPSVRLPERRLWGAEHSLALDEAVYGTRLGGRRDEFAGRSVLIRVADPFWAALALIELDGLARRMVICPPDLGDDTLPSVVQTAEIDAVVFDHQPPPLERTSLLSSRLSPAPDLGAPARNEPIHTEWVLFTSGTSGAPKMVAHSLRGLTRAIKPQAPSAPPPVWGTFYDIRRYGGLQILLRALTGEGSMVLTRPGEPTAELLARLAAKGVTHLTGTPSHWRSLLMNPAAHTISPRYIRLSGEIADQAVLDSLRTFFPNAAIAHAYASTEAGVGFEVNDGLEGFPAALLDGADADLEIRVVDGALRLRSDGAASGYLGPDALSLTDEAGFIDSGDMVERRGERYHFVGRRGGVINVGGLKVHPEEVEAVINRHPAVRMSRVRARRNPITGAIVVADVVLYDARESRSARKDAGLIAREILDACRQTLAPFKTPAQVRFVPTLAMTAGGKLERANG